MPYIYRYIKFRFVWIYVNLLFIVNLFMFILIKIVAGVISERESSGVIGCGLKCTIFMCFLMVFVQIYYHQFCLNFHEPLVNGIVFLLSLLCLYSMLVLFLNKKLLVLDNVDLGTRLCCCSMAFVQTSLR